MPGEEQERAAIALGIACEGLREIAKQRGEVGGYAARVLSEIEDLGASSAGEPDKEARLRGAAQEAGAVIEDLLALMGPRGEKYGLPRQKAAERFLGELRAALAESPVRSGEEGR